MPIAERRLSPPGAPRYSSGVTPPPDRLAIRLLRSRVLAACVRAAAIGTLLLATAACDDGSPGAVARPGGRLLVVGLDGATDKVIGPLVEAGALPHLASLAREGVHSAVRPERPILSPRIWTTFATGVEPEQHGVLDWVQRGEAGLRLYSNLDRTAPALWNIATAHGATVGVVNWLITQPPDRVNGVMVSDHAVPGMTESRLPMARDIATQRFGAGGGDVLAPEVAIAFAHPQEWVARSQQIRAGGGSPLTDVPDPFTGPAWQGHPIFDFLRSNYRDDELTVRTALEVEAATKPRVLLVYLPGVDRVSHLLWQGIEVPAKRIPGLTIHPPALRETHRRALLAYYRFSDALLGRLMARFAADDHVVVLSDHGFEASTSPVTMPGVHESDDARDGILYARGPGIAPGSTAAPIHYTDVLPTLLTVLGLPVAEDLPGTAAGFLDVEPAPSVGSYSDVAVERVESRASDVDGAILEKLRTLGYVE